MNKHCIITESFGILFGSYFTILLTSWLERENGVRSLLIF